MSVVAAFAAGVLTWSLMRAWWAGLPAAPRARVRDAYLGPIAGEVTVIYDDGHIDEIILTKGPHP
jgi:hypothetical protein